MAEIELSHLFRQCLNRRLNNIDEVRREANLWMEYRNKNAYVTNWQFAVNDARLKLRRLYPTVETDKIKKSE